MYDHRVFQLQGLQNLRNNKLLAINKKSKENRIIFLQQMYTEMANPTTLIRSMKEKIKEKRLMKFEKNSLEKRLKKYFC